MWKNPQVNSGGKASGSSSRGGISTASGRGKRKKYLEGEDEDEDEDDGDSRPKRRKPMSSEPTSSTPKFEVMLAYPWDNGPDPTGWWISEKLDGVRYVDHTGHSRTLQRLMFDPTSGPTITALHSTAA